MVTDSTTPSTSPYPDHDTMLFVLEELKESQLGIRAEQRACIGRGDMKLAGLLHAKCNALGAFGDRLVAAYKERGVPTP